MRLGRGTAVAEDAPSSIGGIRSDIAGPKVDVGMKAFSEAIASGSLTLLQTLVVGVVWAEHPQLKAACKARGRAHSEELSKEASRGTGNSNESLQG